MAATATERLVVMQVLAIDLGTNQIPARGLAPPPAISISRRRR
jgi:hypothetical protein